MPDWIKRRDEDLQAQAATFSQVIGDDPEAYGASPQDAAELGDLQASFVEHLQLVSQAATNSTLAHVVKAKVRESLVEAMRRMARGIRAKPGMTREQLVAVGLRPAEPRRQRVNGPTAEPQVYIVGVNHRTVTVRLSDPEHPSRTARPRDVVAAAVFGHVGEEPPVATKDWTSFGTRSRTTFTVKFSGPGVPSGAKVWITAAWIGTRQEQGPGATPAHTHVYGYPIEFPRSRAA
jgi:hypothetical protein